MGPILVFGHRNPDNDSLCSAVAYAHLKNVTESDDIFVPGRLGPVPPETAWVFERFGIDLPDEIPHVRLRARDVMVTELITVGPNESVLSAGRLMGEHDIRSLPVVHEGSVLGLVTMSILAARYVDEFQVTGFTKRSTTVGRLAEALDGRIATGDPDTRLQGNVFIGAMEPETMVGYLSKGDTLVVGDRRRTQPAALEAGIACLVLTGGHDPDPAVVELGSRLEAAVVVTAHDTFAAARLINLSDPVSEMMDTGLVRVAPDTLLAEVAEDLFASPHREAIVEDAEGKVIGLITRSSIARAEPRRVVLVDHNEVSQSAPGVAEASVVEIVDHHRIGDVQTTGPALFLNVPVGSTATIVAQRYEELQAKIPVPVAGILLSAILSDTVLLKSPTTTDVDRDTARRLADLTELDIDDFGMEMFRARSSGTQFSVERAVEADLKVYRFADLSVAIGQVETVDAQEVMAHRTELLEHMDEYREARGHDLVLLMVTDVVREGSELLACGRVRLAERAFGTPFQDGSAWLDGVLSRKKQVAERLAAASG